MTYDLLAAEHARHALRAQKRGWSALADLHAYLAEQYAWRACSVQNVYLRGADGDLGRAIRHHAMDLEESALERAGYVLRAGTWHGTGIDRIIRWHEVAP